MHTCAYPLLDPAVEPPRGHTHRGNCSNLGHRGSVYSALEPRVSGMCTLCLAFSLTRGSVHPVPSCVSVPHDFSPLPQSPLAGRPRECPQSGPW